MNKQDRNDLDNYITGHYGEDQMSPCEETEILLDRRDKQLKRVIYSAREWRRATDIRGEIISRLDAESLRMVRAIEDMTPGGSEFYCDFDRCLAFVQQKIESLQEIAKRKSAILPAPPEDV